MAIHIPRREFIVTLGSAAAWPLAARAQQTTKIPRVGVLWHAGSAEEERVYLGALRQGLSDLGYVEGRTIILENRFPNEIFERFFTLAAELVQSNVDVIVTAGRIAAIAAQRATTTIPIVFVAVPDPVGSKLVASLARPGGNITGFSNMASDLTAKRIELLKETVAGLTRAALLVNLSDEAGAQKYIEEGEIAGRRLGVTVQAVGVRGAGEIESAFAKMTHDQLQGVVVTVDGLFYANKERVAALALKHRLPTVVYSRETLEAAALMSYGPNQVSMFRRAAKYVERILKGEKPADLPVDQPSTFELIVNRTIAKALGVTIPDSILARADDLVDIDCRRVTSEGVCAVN